METFPLLTAPDWGLQSNPTADVEEQKLGDGYVLRRAKGLNHLRESWTPSWSFLTEAEAESNYAWLRTQPSASVLQHQLQGSIEPPIGGGDTYNIAPEINIEYKSEGSSSPEQSRQDATMLGNTVKLVVLDTLKNEMRPNGMLYRR